MDEARGEGTIVKRFINTSGRDLPVYADDGLSKPLGVLFKDGECFCIHEMGAPVLILYKVTSSAFKVGYSDFIPGIQE